MPVTASASTAPPLVTSLSILMASSLRGSLGTTARAATARRTVIYGQAGGTNETAHHVDHCSTFSFRLDRERAAAGARPAGGARQAEVRGGLCHRHREVVQ